MTSDTISPAANPRAAGDWIYWFYLFGAVVFEVGGTCVMKYSQNSPYISPLAGYVAMLALIALSYYLLSLSAQGLAVGVAFAFWEGLGLTLITLASVGFLGEPLTPARAAALVAVLVGALLVHHGTDNVHESKDDAATPPQSAPLQEAPALAQTPSALRHTKGGRS